SGARAGIGCSRSRETSAGVYRSLTTSATTSGGLAGGVPHRRKKSAPSKLFWSGGIKWFINYQIQFPENHVDSRSGDSGIWDAVLARDAMRSACARRETTRDRGDILPRGGSR